MTNPEYVCYLKCVCVCLFVFTEQSKLLMYLKSCYFFLIDDRGHVHVMQ